MEGNNSDRGLVPQLAELSTAAGGPVIPFGFLARGRSYRQSVEKLFPNMSAADYMLMWLVAGKTHAGEGEKIYLVDLAKTLQLPIHQVSNIVKELKAKGLVEWKHDGEGERGTYICLTESSMEALREQHEILHGFYQDVIALYGEQEFVTLLRELSRLEEVISDVMKDKEDPNE